jgi:hypothetical protein
MRKLVAVQKFLSDAEADGVDPETLMLDPDDVCSVDLDDLDLDDGPEDEDSDE